MGVFVCVHLRKKKMRRRTELVGCAERRERKKGGNGNEYNNKCTCYSNRAYMHGYCSNCAKMHNYAQAGVDGFFTQMVEK